MLQSPLLNLRHQSKWEKAKSDRAKINEGVREHDQQAIWQPFPNTNNEFAYHHIADELFYGGKAGVGKSILLLLLARDSKSSLILRREFPRTRALIEKSREIFGGRSTPDSKDSFNESTHLWRLQNGSTIEFGACQYEETKNKYQGREHQNKLWDEITEFSEAQYRFVNIWCRDGDPNTRSRIVVTGNPPTTVDGEWVIDYWCAFIDDDFIGDRAEEGSLVWYVRAKLAINEDEKDVEIGRTSVEQVREHIKNGTLPDRPTYRHINPDTQEEIILEGRSRSFLSGSLEDNKIMIAKGYDKKLQALPEFERLRFALGKFQRVTESTDLQLIPTAYIVAAQQRWIDFIGNKNLDPRKAIAAYQTKTEIYKMTSIGADPARGGDDDACFAPRFGDWIAPIYCLAGKLVQDGDDIRDYLQGIMIGNPDIYMDIIGIGTSPYDSCRRMGWKIHSINVGSVAVDRAGRKLTDRTGLLSFANIRAMLAWKLMEALDPQYNPTLMLPPDPKLKQELCNIRRASTDGGVITLEGKDKVKARIGRSPDRADAVQLCLMEKLSQPAIIQKSQAMALEKIRGWS